MKNKNGGRHRVEKTRSHKTSRKHGLIAGALLAAAGTLGAAFGAAAYHHASEPEWDSSPPPYYTFGDGSPKVSKDRILIQAWGTVMHTIRGNAHYMDEQPPALNKPMTFLVYSVDEVKRLGVRPKNFYKATVECRNSGELGCRVLKAEGIEAKNYRILEEAAQDAVNKALPGHDLQAPLLDFARQVAVFQDTSSGQLQLVKVKCTNPLDYSCTVTQTPARSGIPRLTP